MLYNVIYKLRKDLEGLSTAEQEIVKPTIRRVSAPDAKRAIAKAVNALQDEGKINSQGEVKILESKQGV